MSARYSPEQRERAFMSRVRFTDGCWEWTAAKRAGGYGVFWSGESLQCAHRYAYERMVGAIPDGLELDHLCRNHACVRPDHLEPVSRQLNLLRGDTVAAQHAMRSRCARGHEYDEELYLQPGTKRPIRRCSTCRDDYNSRPEVRAKKREYMRRRRAERKTA